jgi:hypothetical protein
LWILSGGWRRRREPLTDRSTLTRPFGPPSPVRERRPFGWEIAIAKGSLSPNLSQRLRSTAHERGAGGEGTPVYLAFYDSQHKMT